MGCIKCGREIEEDQVFCNECLEVMNKYPVKPNTAIQLPQRKEVSPLKKASAWRRQVPTPEEQILRLKKRLKTAVILWLVTLLLLAAAVYPTVRYFQGEVFLLPGQNYNTVSDFSDSNP